MRIGIFVDAGYLFAAGSEALTGEKRPRIECSLSPAAAREALLKAAGQIVPTREVLRIYWYDGALLSGLNSSQRLIARLPDVKLRLGLINSHGQQKGVDSLIVADLIDLARNKAIADAVLVAGDEDVRVGVQIAQSYGIRIHLIGISGPKANQSPSLLDEADTCSVWKKDDVEPFLSLQGSAASTHDAASQQELAAVVEKFWAELPPETQSGVKGRCSLNGDFGRIPSEMDRKLLPYCGRALGHALDDNEKKAMRRHFAQLALGG